MNEVKASGTLSILGNRILLAYCSIYGELIGLYRKIQEYSCAPGSYPHDTEKVPTTSIGRSEVHPVMVPHHRNSGLPFPFAILADSDRPCVRIPLSTIQPGIVIPPLRLIISDKGN